MHKKKCNLGKKLDYDTRRIAYAILRKHKKVGRNDCSEEKAKLLHKVLHKYPSGTPRNVLLTPSVPHTY